jgi:hypothetical protein
MQGGNRPENGTNGRALDELTTGLLLGATIAAIHLAWAVLVALGMAQSVIDFLFWIHFIEPPYRVAPLDFGRAAILVTVAAVVGLLVGAGFAAGCNAVRKVR